MSRGLLTLISGALLLCPACASALGATNLFARVKPDALPEMFAQPPDSARPGAYWYFMDGNLSREGITRDLESMKAAGMGHVIFLEVNVGVPRGPVNFLSDQWQDLFAHAVREAERLGIELILGSGPGWTGSGGPWVRPEQSMQHLVGSKVEVQGPGRFGGMLPVPPPHRPFFGDVPASLREKWQNWYYDVAILAFPTPTAADTITDLDEKALVYRAPFSSQPGTKPRLEAPADHAPSLDGSNISLKTILDLTDRLRPDGTLDWQIPAGKWTIARFVSRNNGASTRPAPEPGVGFECDKFDAPALDAHFEAYAGKLLRKVGQRQKGRGWTMLHIDSWEMGAQNWTPNFRREFVSRRGYDPQPFYPVYLGFIVGSREQSERFLWDLRATSQELIIRNHAEHLKKLGRKHGFALSIEPYDMNPANDFDLGSVADVPMCEFWSLGFDTAFSCHTASSIAHVVGRPIVAAEAFTAGDKEAWRFYPGVLKNQGDWAFATGINRLTYHTFAHKPDEGRPGMVMGPYGVHWDRGQTWWPMVSAYHRYISRCQYMLRQGRSVADVLYLMPEGAPNVFQPPPSAFEGTTRLPDRRGYNFDGCSANALVKNASVRSGSIVFPSGATYRLLVLPTSETMTPELVHKLENLVKQGATIVGNPPRKSPSLVGYPQCDRDVADQARKIWGDLECSEELIVRPFGKGQVIRGNDLNPKTGEEPRRYAILDSSWIWLDEPKPTQSARIGFTSFRREFVVPLTRQLSSARLEMTADNSFRAVLNDVDLLQGDNFHEVYVADASKAIRRGTNGLFVTVENAGTAANPAGLVGSLVLEFTDGTRQVIATDSSWSVQWENESATWRNAKVLGPATMAPWNLKVQQSTSPIYPHYDVTATLLAKTGVPEDFSSTGPVRYGHRRTSSREIYFLANRSDRQVVCKGTFRVAKGLPELWDPVSGTIRRLPEYNHLNGRTEIPLRFEPYESYFIVFPQKRTAMEVRSGEPHENFPKYELCLELNSSWDVTFDTAMGGPAHVRFERLEDWSKSPEPEIRYYSGTATYRTQFDFQPAQSVSLGRYYLELGEVEVMARVRLNGITCGINWTAPRMVDISRALRPGTNLLEVEVANLWPNRMIGDASSEKKFTETTYRPYKSEDKLLPSGLMGPVRVMREAN